MRPALLLPCIFFACATTPPQPRDACSLLTTADIEQVQGERPAETKATDRDRSHQCFYRLPTFAKSISVSVSYGARELWEQRIHGERGEEKEEEEAKERPKPRTIRGLGDEAIWSATPVGGTLYVLQGDTMLFIGIGGGDADAVRLEKATALARKALRKLR